MPVYGGRPSYHLRGKSPTPLPVVGTITPAGVLSTSATFGSQSAGIRSTPASLAALQYLSGSYISTYSAWKPTSGTTYNMPIGASQAAQDSFLSTVPAGTVNNPSIIYMAPGNTWSRSSIMSLGVSHPYTILWGYGAFMHHTAAASQVANNSCIRIGEDNPASGSAHHIKVLGLTLYGDNALAMTASAYRGDGAAGFLINGSVADIEMADCYVHNTMGDNIFFYADTLARTYQRIDIHNNRMTTAGRCTLANMFGDDIYLTWNRMENCATTIIDWEDSGTTSQHFNRTYVRDNIIDGWFWGIPAANKSVFSMYLLPGPDGTNHVIHEPVTELYIERNTFLSGCQSASLGSNPNAMMIGWDYATTSQVNKTGMYVRNNDFSGIPGAKRFGPFVNFTNVTGGAVTGNTGIGTMTVGQYTSTGITVSGNTA